MLLIPETWRRAKNEGVAEERKRVRRILAEYEQIDPETGAITVVITPEIMRELFCELV